MTGQADGQPQGRQTVGQALPWAAILLNYTDEVCSNVSAEHWDLRPSDPGGHYWFSLGEMVMHLADSRRYIISLISGEDAQPHLWRQKYGGLTEDWGFKPGSREEAVASLKQARELIKPFFDLPAEQLSQPTAASIKAYDEHLAMLKAEAQDSPEPEKKGPQTVADCLLLLIAHEQSHRGVLQALLRLNGLEVTRYA